MINKAAIRKELEDYIYETHYLPEVQPDELTDEEIAALLKINRRNIRAILNKDVKEGKLVMVKRRGRDNKPCWVYKLPTE